MWGGGGSVGCGRRLAAETKRRSSGRGTKVQPESSRLLITATPPVRLTVRSRPHLGNRALPHGLPWDSPRLCAATKFPGTQPAKARPASFWDGRPPVLGLVARRSLGPVSRQFLGWSPAGFWVRSPLRNGISPGSSGPPFLGLVALEWDFYPSVFGEQFNDMLRSSP